jgi:hypothetical protein
MVIFGCLTDTWTDTYPAEPPNIRNDCSPVSGSPQTSAASMTATRQRVSCTSPVLEVGPDGRTYGRCRRDGSWQYTLRSFDSEDERREYVEAVRNKAGTLIWELCTDGG